MWRLLHDAHKPPKPRMTWYLLKKKGKNRCNNRIRPEVGSNVLGVITIRRKEMLLDTAFFAKAKPNHKGQVSWLVPLVRLPDNEYQ